MEFADALDSHRLRPRVPRVSLQALSHPAGGLDAIESRSSQQACASVGAVIDTAVDAIITIDANGVIRLFNRAAERVFGYTAAEVIGRNVSLLMPEPFSSRHDEYVRNYLAGGVKKIIGIGREVVARRKDGSTFPADLAVGEDPSNPVHRFVGFVRDISLRKSHETRIREQAELIDQIQEPIFVQGIDDRVLYWNRGAEQLFGWTSSEALGKHLAELIPPAVLNDVDKAKQACLAAGTWRGELERYDRWGKRHFIDSYWTLIRDEFGKPKSIIIIAKDVTERKQLERRSLRSQRLESIGTLAGGIAHDLNNVLTPILMALRLLQKDRPPEQRKEILDAAQASLERGTALIKQLLTFAGGGTSAKATVNIAELVTEVRSLLEHTLMKTVVVHVATPPDLWRVSGDATQLSQVLMNLCVNARDAMPHGGTLTIAAENLSLTHPVISVPDDVPPGRYVRLSVADTGEGIPPELMDKIFDPFFTTKEFGKGTGLGLSTTLGIARGHGGAVNVYSEPGRGTRVAVYLPALVSEAAAKGIAAATPSPGGSGEGILVVDDEAPILATVRLVLEAAGYSVLTAPGGAEAIEVYRAHRDEIAAVLIDMMMPGMDGPTAIAELARLDPAVKVITASGLRAHDWEWEGAALRPRAFLQKPYSEEELLQTLSKVLNG